MGAVRIHTLSCYLGELLTQTFKKVEQHRVLQEEDGNHIEVFRGLRQLSHTASCLTYLGSVTSLLP